MNKIFNLTSTFKALDQDDDSIVIGGMASTKDFDRAGDTILPEAWAKGGLHNFEKNPIILFNHDYNLNESSFFKKFSEWLYGNNPDFINL